MAVKLDDLLEATGVSKLAGNSGRRAAEEPPDLLKLAERCRRAAEATPEERSSAVHQDLVEKTAAVEIIRRTLDEIRSLSSDHTKVAADRDATFIKAALAAGHSPEAIATFLDQVRASRAAG